MKKLLTAFLLMVCLGHAQTSERHRVKSLRIEVLSTMLSSGSGIGEWGFSAVVDVDGHRFLFDTGGRSEAVLKNAKELHVDLSNIPDVILSHHHPDHRWTRATRFLSRIEPNMLPGNRPSNDCGPGVSKSRHDRRSLDCRREQESILAKIRDIERTAPAPVDQAIDMMGLMSRASELFLEQPAAEKRRLLQVVVEKASWKGEQLQTALFEPFEILRHSNRESYRKQRLAPRHGFEPRT
jgi:metallo-beta-lactamase superfamily protein